MPSGDEFGVPIHMFEKTSQEQVRISLNEYKGHEYVDIRVFFWDGTEHRPTKKGLTLRREQYPELLHGVIELGKAIGFEDLFED